MELRFIVRAEPDPKSGKDVGRLIKVLQVRGMDLIGGKWRLGPWQDVPFVKPEDE